MAPVTLSKIATITVGAAGAASINFTNIPQIYTDLKIVMSARTTYNAPTGQYISFNGSTSNFSNKYLFSDGSGASTGSIARYAGTVMGNATASVFNNTEIYITGYTSSNYKPFSVDNVAENNATYGAINIISGLWSDSAAITSISIAPDNGSYPQYSTATLYGVKSLERSSFASGGEVSEIGGYYIHTFKGSGTFTPTVPLSVEYLIVAGGGGGGRGRGGGGGAGGLLTGATSVNSQNYTVTVGLGGNGSTNTSIAGTNGSNSVFNSVTAIGGGGGGSDGDPYIGNPGGSGGGASIWANTNAAGTAGQGNAGGNNGGSYLVGGSGGGGGAGSVGGNATTNISGSGGSGITSSISGASTTYAGGGGGGNDNGKTAGTGSAGGGNGATDSNAGGNATANTGSGGGGGGRNASNGNTGNGGSGGSGIVIIRYRR